MKVDPSRLKRWPESDRDGSALRKKQRTINFEGVSARPMSDSRLPQHPVTHHLTVALTAPAVHHRHLTARKDRREVEQGVDVAAAKQADNDMRRTARTNLAKLGIDRFVAERA